MDEIHDIEHQLEPELPPPGPGVPWGGIVMAIGLILVVVFAVQNTDQVAVDFLWFSWSFPLSIVILTTAVAAGLITIAGGAFFRRRRRRRRADKEALKKLQG